MFVMSSSCTDHEKVLFAAHQLFGTATYWWEAYRNTHTNVEAITWNEFKAHFRTHYVPRDTLELKKKEFSDLNQGSMMVNEYLNQFIQLSRYTTDDVNTDEKKQDTFLKGLKVMRTSVLWIQPHLFIGVGVRLVFGLQESTYLRQLSRLHMDSNLGLLLLHGNIIKSTSRRIHPNVDTLLESVTITDFIQRYILSMVSLFLYAFINDSENRLLPNNVMMIRNYGGDKEGLKERRGGAKEQKRRPIQVGVPIQVELKSNSDFRIRPPKSSPRSHTNSVLDVLYMDGKIRGSTFQWKQYHIHIPSESTGNVETMRRTKSVTVLCYHILAPWAMYQVGPNRDTS
jgi:hypothetical protein